MHSPTLRFVALAASLTAVVLLPGPTEARPRREAASTSAGPQVDVSRLRALGLGPTADLVQTAIARELASGGVSQRGRVQVVMTGLSMNNYSGGEGGGGGGGGDGGGGGGGGSNNDYLEGEILILGPGGQVLEGRHQVVSLPASSGGAYYLPGAEQRRVIAISQAFAEWARRAAL